MSDLKLINKINKLWAMLSRQDRFAFLKEIKEKNEEIGEEKLEQWLGENIPEALRHRENKERRLINAVKNNNKKDDVALRRLLQKTIRETKKSERLEKKYTKSQARKATLKRPSSIVSIDSTIADLDNEIKKTKETLDRLEKLRKRLTFNKKRVLTNIKRKEQN